MIKLKSYGYLATRVLGYLGYLATEVLTFIINYQLPRSMGCLAPASHGRECPFYETIRGPSKEDYFSFKWLNY